ncbi:hypothetical protein SCREM1_107 [Synechococcus phage S-CREM1]|nr:hypothetical protein SCREM1_107 [Synechococcus phage S-CREM1]
MSNPLLDTFDELYGVPKEETPEETTEETPNTVGELKFDTTTSTLMIGNGSQYLTANNPAYISNGITCSTITTLSNSRSFSIPNQTPAEQHFCKVLEDVANKKATVSAISADIDTAFTGFGGQIRYTVEIIGTYP